MKKFFAFAMAIVSMAAVMTSCSNDEADFVAQKAPVAPTTQTTTHVTPKADKVENEVINETFDGTLYISATTQQLDLFDNVYTISAGGQTFEVNVADLQETTYQPERTAEMMAAYRAKYTDGELKTFTYKLPVAVSSRLDVQANAHFSIKDGVELPEKVFAVCGMSDKDGWGSFKGTTGLVSEKVPGYLEKVVNALTYRLDK